MSDIETTTGASGESGPDLNAIADRLFGKSSVPSAPADQLPPVEAAKPAEATQADAKPATETPAAAIELPDAIRELRDDPLRRMFSPQGTYASVQLEESMKDVALDPAVKTAAAVEFREIFADFEASPQDAHELVSAATRFTAEPMTTERDASNTNAAIELLNQHFGNDAKSALAAAQQMIARDPRLSRMLDQTRLGNDPKTVLKIAQLARSAKMRG
ncbi:hypothetical protein B0G74_0665 [Paraburkholderia sp. BL9I2N2]|nr:hypothetical protein B0G74_0665 [Paraburkholderia sp. BL9I2N2]